MQDQRESRTVLERLLNLFTEVRTGEGVTVLLLALNVFLLLASYYFIKPVREALILSDGGAEVKSYLIAGMAVLLFFIVPAYARLVNRLERTRLIGIVTSIFMACLVVFWILSRLNTPYLGYIFFIWIGIFNVMVVAQFWSFANDVYSNEAGKRLFPIVAFGGSFGAFAGAYVADWLLGVVGIYEILLLSAAVLGVCILLTVIISRRVFLASIPTPATGTQRPEGRRFEGFDLLFKHRYLGYIAVLVLVLNLVNTNGEYVLGSLAEDHGKTAAESAAQAAIDAGEPLRFGTQELGDPATDEAKMQYTRSAIGAFYANFFFWVNLLGMALQLLLVGRLVKYGGIQAALFMLPIIALGTYALIAVMPVLAYARIGKTFENATDYSVNKTALQMLFLPTSQEIKYKAKQAIDSFMQRLGDVISAGVVFLGTVFLGLSARGFAGLNLVIVLIWGYLAYRIVREHRRIEAGEVPEIAA